MTETEFRAEREVIENEIVRVRALPEVDTNRLSLKVGSVGALPTSRKGCRQNPAEGVRFETPAGWRPTGGESEGCMQPASRSDQGPVHAGASRACPYASTTKRLHSTTSAPTAPPY
jgi:hypothetical protein